MGHILGADHRRLSFRAPHPDRELDAYVRRFRELSKATGVELEVTSLRGAPFTRLHVPALGPHPVRLLITATIHGDERAGPAAALEVTRWVLENPELRRQVDLTVLPTLNPSGFLANTRLNADGENFNRAFDKPREDLPLEVREIQKSLGSVPFDLAVDLHSSCLMKEGFFLIGNEQKGTPGKMQKESLALARKALKKVSSNLPLAACSDWAYVRMDTGLFTSTNRGTLRQYLAEQGSHAVYTLESPAVLSYRRRVQGSAALVRALVESRLEKKKRQATEISEACRPTEYFEPVNEPLNE